MNGVLLGAVPGIAICESFNSDELLLFHCDDDWDVLGIQAWKKGEDPDVNLLEQVKSRTEKYYAGISFHWMDHAEGDRTSKQRQVMVDIRTGQFSS